MKTIIYGVNFGRDSDTIVTMVGASGLKQEWIEKAETNNPEYKITISNKNKKITR